MRAAGADILADPFAEESAGGPIRRLPLLGADFHFASQTAALAELVTAAYGGLPMQHLTHTPPRIRVKLALLPDGAPRRVARPAAAALISGAGFLCAAHGASAFAIVSPLQRSGLVSLSKAMLRHPYHARYEYLEFAVFMLAARVQGLVPLHAACVGRNGEGVLLMGPSGAGKSTAALHCLLRGLEFVAEDAVFACPRRLLATGVANYLHVCRSALPWLRHTRIHTQVRTSPVISRRSGVRKFEVDLRRGPFQLAAAPLKVRALLFLSAESAGRHALLRRVPARQLRAALTLNQPYAAGRPEWPAFLRQAGCLPAFTLRRGRHPDEAVDAIERVLQAGGRAGAAPGPL